MLRLMLAPKTAPPSEVGSSSSTAGTGAFGTQVLHDPPDSVADIVFIHGLTGDRERTWRAKDQPECWPKAILPRCIPEARILTFGYDASVTNWREWPGKVSRNSIRGHAGNLLHAIAAHRIDPASERTVMFVCHSLGGLVCKDRKKERGPLSVHLRNTRGVIFLGTPHQGSSIAAWAEGLARIVGVVKSTNRRALHDLRQSSEELVRIQESFQNLLGSREVDGFPPIEVICCYEELPSPGVGQIVTQHSATLAGSSLPIGIHSSHASMTKFASEHDPGYKAIAGVLHRWVKPTVDASASAYSGPRTLSTVFMMSSPSTPRSSTGSSATDSDFFRVPAGEKFIISDKVVTLPFHFLPRASVSSGRYFQPREAELAKITSALLPEHPTPRQLRSFVITGLGGCGKTELAYKFIAEHKADYDAIIFLTADSRNRLSEQYTKLAIRLGLVRESDHTAEAEGHCRSALHSWLENPIKGVPGDGETPKLLSWLLILDNVESEEDILDFLPRCDQGTILITSRETIFDYPGIPLKIDGSLRLGSLAGRDATLLLRHLIGPDVAQTPENDAAIMNLAEKQLGGLPLAIHQIAAVMHRQRLSPSRFIKKYPRSQLYTLFSHRPAFQDYQHSLATVWALNSLPRGAFAILCLISMLDPVGIDDRLLEPTPLAGAIDDRLLELKLVGSDPAPEDGLAGATDDRESTITYRYPQDDATYMNEKSVLCDSSLIEVNREDGRVTVHRLVQHVMRAHIHEKKPSVAALAFKDSLHRVQELWPFVSRNYVPGALGDMRRWDKCNLLLPHIIHLSEVCFELQPISKHDLGGKDLAELLLEAAGFRILHELAHLAEPLVQAAERIYEHDPAAWSEHDIGQLYWARTALAMQHRDGTAMLKHATKALDLEKARNPQDLASLAPAYIHIANAHALHRNWDESAAMLECSARIRKKLPNFTRDFLFSVQYHLGIVLYHKGEYREAAVVLEQGIKDRCEAFKEKEETVPARMAALHYALGIVQFALGEFDKSLENKQRALSLNRDNAGPAQRATLTCMYHVAKHYEMKRDWAQVDAYCSKILHYHSFTPQYYLDIARVAFLYSKSCTHLGKADLAKEWLKTATEMYNRLRPSNRRTMEALTEEDVSELVVYDTV